MEKIEYRYRFWYRYRPKFMVSDWYRIEPQKAGIAHHYFAPSLAFFLWRLRSFAQRLRSCSQIRHVKCSEMYLIVILNPKKTKASAEERDKRPFCSNHFELCNLMHVGGKQHILSTTLRRYR
jgi:hypothetical protein